MRSYLPCGKLPLLERCLPLTKPVSRCRLAPTTLTVTPDVLSRSISLSSFCSIHKSARRSYLLKPQASAKAFHSPAERRTLYG